MTQLLVSVRSATEALAAMAGGATIIDVKEPAHGSLGRADNPIWQEVAQAVESLDKAPNNTFGLSVALGELHEIPSGGIRFPPGIAFAKVGLSAMRNQRDWPQLWQRWQQSLPGGIEAVAVCYADCQRAKAPTPEDILHIAIDSGVKTLLIDTFDKSAGSLLEVASHVWLQDFCSQVQTAGLNLAVAGSLRLVQIPKILQLAPQIIAVRTAACEAGRASQVSEARVREIAQVLASSRSSGSLPGKNDNPATIKILATSPRQPDEARQMSHSPSPSSRRPTVFDLGILLEDIPTD